jgi:hypothetical protein
MYVATSTNRMVAETFSGEGMVMWQFTIPAGCLQVKDIRTVSVYAPENEVLFVPYTVVRIDHKEVASVGTTLHARVLRDAKRQLESQQTILA